MKKQLTALFVLAHLFCFGQKVSKQSALRFQSLNQIGFVYGEASAEPILQSINGIRIQSFFIGAGVGLDYYNERSVPIFLDIRKQLLNKAKSPFIYINGGYHAMLVKDQPQEWINQGFKGGLYYDAGIGYSFPVFNSKAFVISMGYSSKEMSETRNKNPWRSSLPQPEDFETLDYKLRRYSFKLGLAL